KSLCNASIMCLFFFFQAEDGIRDRNVTGVQTCALPIFKLIKSVLRFPGMIASAAESREPHRLINYLEDLATDFTAFYHHCHILGEKEKRAQSRTVLAKATAQVLANGLGILGIAAPEQM